MVTINGQPTEADGMTVADYLRQNQFGTERVAVERNLEILPRTQYETTVLADGDTLEIVCFVGGG